MKWDWSWIDFNNNCVKHIKVINNKQTIDLTIIYFPLLDHSLCEGHDLLLLFYPFLIKVRIKPTITNIIIIILSSHLPGLLIIKH